MNVSHLECGFRCFLREIDRVLDAPSHMVITLQGAKIGVDDHEKIIMPGRIDRSIPAGIGHHSLQILIHEIHLYRLAMQVIEHRVEKRVFLTERKRLDLEQNRITERLQNGFSFTHFDILTLISLLDLIFEIKNGLFRRIGSREPIKRDRSGDFEYR